VWAQKDSIWGQGFRDFMGIGGGTDSTGVQQYQDQPGDYSRACSAESYVWTAEQRRMKSISQVPLKVWQSDSQGNRKAIDHDALAVLDTTNPYGYCAGIPDLMSYTLWSLDFHGRTAWKFAFSRTRQPTEVYWQIPSQWSPVADPDSFFGGIRLRGSDKLIPPDQLAYKATINGDDPLMGTSKIKVLKNPLNLRAFSQQNNIDFFENSMRPDWILSGSWNNTQDNMDRIRRAVRRMLSGANNRAPLILGEGATAHLLTTSHEDAQWVEQQRLAQEEISAVFGVPLVFLNNLERSTYDNVKTAKLILWHDTMIPECDELARFMDLQFLWRFWPGSRESRISFGFDYDEIQGLGEDLAMIWERALNLLKVIDSQVKGFQLTPNQARPLYAKVLADLGLDPSPYTGDVPGGDNFYQAFTNVPVDQLSVQAVMDIWAMRGQNPEFVESIPGAPTAGQNADAVAERLNKPPEPPPLPPGPPPPPALPPPPDHPPPSAPPPPQKAIDYEALRREVAEELRRDVEQVVGQAAVRAFGDALSQRQAPPDPHQKDVLTRRLKRYFQDQQTDVLRTMRQASGPLPPDLYSRGVYRGRLAELVGDEAADEAEHLTQLALRDAVASHDPRAAVVGLYREALDHRVVALVEGKAYSPETKPRDPEHLHDYGQNNKPVISFDLHNTLTPDDGFPLVSPPFPGVRQFLNLMAARGCCLHISTASLDETDPDVVEARKDQIEDWAARFGLPIGYICSNSHAQVRVDDRAIQVPHDPDWSAISKTAQAQLEQTHELDENGQYTRRKDLVPVGDRRQTWPKLSSVPADRPRGFSTPMIDIDVHRTLDPAWGTGRTPQAPDPQAVAVVRGLYDAGYQIQFSCAGWNPALDVDGAADDRLAGIVQYLLTYDIPYDRVVSKDDYDVRIDDKARPFTTWPEVRAAVLGSVGPPKPKGQSPPFVKAAEQPLSSRPLHDQLQAAEDHYEAEVKRTFAAAVDTKALAEGWTSRYPGHKTGGAQVSAGLLEAAIDYVRGHGLNLQGLGEVIRAIYTDGWRVGIGSALARLRDTGSVASSQDPAAGIDWSTWKPGNQAAADQAARLGELLSQADVVLQGVSDTALQQIAGILAEGAAAGDSVDTIARALGDVLGDPSHALMVAHTELARAVSAASLETYRYNGIPGKGWITYQPCPICAQNEGVVVPLDAAFPSGDTSPPAHPRCRCSLVPETTTGVQS
jgi:HK97 family phage portal protein